jgi:hypothetical protein
MIANELMDDAKRSKNEVVIIQSRLWNFSDSVDWGYLDAVPW